MHSMGFSFIESAALRVGDYTIEVHRHEIYVGTNFYTPEDLPITFGGDFQYTISEAEVESFKNPKTHAYFKVDLHQDSSILFKFYKKLMTIDVSGHAADFSDNTGLMGEYHTGDMYNRAGQPMTSFQQFGHEWQVNHETDPALFRDNRAPQLPMAGCNMPPANPTGRRRLRAVDHELQAAAQTACAASHAGASNDFDLCVQDVMLTGDVGMAQAW
jgi:hypothetical protein